MGVRCSTIKPKSVINPARKGKILTLYKHLRYIS